MSTCSTWRVELVGGGVGWMELEMSTLKVFIKLSTRVIAKATYLVNLPTSFNIEDNTVATTDKTTAAKMAGTQPSIFTPGITAATINKTTALTTKANSPKVTTLSGAVIKLKAGLMKVLTTPKTTAAKRAVVKLAT